MKTAQFLLLLGAYLAPDARGAIRGFEFLADAQDSGRKIEILADSDNRFKLPGQKQQVLVLKTNEPVILEITAHRGQEWARDGAVHSLVVRSLRDQGWDIRLKEGTQTVQLRAPSAPGTYWIECTVRCGDGHDNMKLKMVVER